jgi:hypothetical protein
MDNVVPLHMSLVFERLGVEPLHPLTDADRDAFIAARLIPSGSP